MPKTKKNKQNNSTKQHKYKTKYIYLISNIVNHLEKKTKILGKFKKPENLEKLTHITINIKKKKKPYQPHINGNVIGKTLTTFNETIILCHRIGSNMVPFKHNNKSVFVNITSEFDIYDLVWTNKKETININNSIYDELNQKISSNDSGGEDDIINNRNEQMKLEEKLLKNDFEGEKLINEDDIIDLNIEKKIDNVDQIENEEEREEVKNEIKKLKKDLAEEDENITVTKYKNNAFDRLKALEDVILNDNSDKNKIIKLLKFNNNNNNQTNKNNNMDNDSDSYNSSDSSDSSESFDQFELFNKIFDTVKKNKDGSYNKSTKMKKTNNSLFTFKFGLCHQKKKVYLTEIKITLLK